VFSFGASPLIFIALVRSVVAGKTSGRMHNRCWGVTRCYHMQAGDEAVQGWFGRTSVTAIGHRLLQGWLAGGPSGTWSLPRGVLCRFGVVAGPLIHGRLRWCELINQCFAPCHQGCVSPLFLLKSLYSTIF
jgi:hypothetical protein